MNKFSSLLALLLLPLFVVAQTGSIRGIVKDKKTEAPLQDVVVALEGTALGTMTDSLGSFIIRDIPFGSYNVRFQFLGYQPAAVFNVVVSAGNVPQLSVVMDGEQGVGLKEVVVRKNPFARSTETPLSIQSLSGEEIKSNPGGNFDVSRVIQGFPGVGGTSGSVGGYRNDIIIRGGAPNENVYYLDGVEVPVINHFATQGSAGGPTGILNISFINNVDLYTSAFPAKYDNPLSGVLQLKQRESNPDRVQKNLRLSATELAFAADGPINDKISFQMSARRSYLQLLFQALQIPIQPSYWDFQYKINYKINKKLTFYTLGIGAIDNFSFLVPDEQTPENIYTIRSNPLINQWNYTNGYVLKKLIDKGSWQLVFSRNMLNNSLDKFEDNQNQTEATRTLKLRSVEAENKLRFETNKYLGKFSYSYGGMVQYDRFTNSLFARIRNAVTDSLGNVIVPAISATGNVDINFIRYGVFVQGGYKMFDSKLSLSLGLRTDGNTFTNSGNDLLKQLSPRLSASYKVSEKLNANASFGRYYKIPTYTILGFTDTAGNFVNKDAKYLSSDHYVAGLEYFPGWDGARMTLEGFYKVYANYPVSLLDSLSLANKGGDFAVLGNEPISYTGKGNSYGIEFQFQQKFLKNFFTILSYTYYKSEFTNLAGRSLPASWDNRHLLSFIGGYKFKRNIELGVKFRYQGGAPYSPFDLAASQRNYALLGTGIIDYAQFNTLRLPAFHSLDFRVDKKWNFKKYSLDLYLDVTNAYASLQPATPNYTFQRTADNTAFQTTDGNALRPDGANAIPLILNNASRTVIPTIGFILDF